MKFSSLKNVFAAFFSSSSEEYCANETDENANKHSKNKYI